MEEKLGRRLGESELELSRWAMATIGEAVSAGDTPSTSFISRPGKWLSLKSRCFGIFRRQCTVKIALALSAADRFRSSAAKNEVSFLDRQHSAPSDQPFVRPPTPCHKSNGQPALTVPLYWNSDNFIGTQLSGCRTRAAVVAACSPA